MPAQAWLKKYGPVLGIFIVAVMLTEAYYLGDTADYVASVLGHISNSHSGRWDPLWDFGHLLWRPLGLIILTTLQAISADAGLPLHLLLTRGYIGVSILCGAGVAVLLYSLALSATRSRSIAICVASAFILSNAVLNYTQTGNAYVAGLLFITLGVWIIKRSTDTGRLTRGAAIGGGIAIACSVLFWFPYIFVLPAALLIPFLFRHSENEPLVERVRFSLTTAVATGVVMMLAYGAIILHLRLYSVADLTDWVTHAAHGVKPGIVANSMRLVFGIPRAFIDMGDDGKMIKRYLYSDPYSPASLTDILQTSAVPLLLFYGTLLALLWFAGKSPAGRRAVWLFAAAFVPVVLFAVGLFEAGAMERYFPIYPFLAVVVAQGLHQRAMGNVHRYLALALMALIVVRSGLAVSTIRSAERQRIQAERVAPVREDVGQKGVFVLLNYQDELMHFAKTYPFHPLNRPNAVPIYCIFEPGTPRMDGWRAEFADRVSRVWEGGGNVWLSKRFIAERPVPAWNWVEGDDARITWAKSRDFFRQFEYSRESGGVDGFVELKRSEANRTRLSPFISLR